MFPRREVCAAYSSHFTGGYWFPHRSCQLAGCMESLQCCPKMQFWADTKIILTFIPPVWKMKSFKSWSTKKCKYSSFSPDILKEVTPTSGTSPWQISGFLSLMLIKVDKQCKALGVGERTQRDTADLKRDHFLRVEKPVLPLHLCFRRGNTVPSGSEQALEKLC